MRGLARFVFGLEADHPMAFRRLRTIGRGVYRTIIDLDAEIQRSDEPIPFDRLDRDGFRPLKPGTAWGKKFDCAWLRITGPAPPHTPDDAVVLLGIRGEGLVFSPTGDILDAVSTVFLQGDLPHPAGSYRPVRGAEPTGGRIEFYADVAYNGILIYDYGSAVYHGARLARRDDVVHALYFDYLTLLVLALSTEDDALAASLHAALDAAYRAYRRGDAAGARERLAPHLSAESDSAVTYRAVGHGHLDMAWLWPLRETRRKAARTYVRALNNIDERERYIYGTSQPQQMLWMKQRHPQLFQRMKDAVAAGRMELQGSFWVEPDTNLPSGESLIRQALVGRRFLETEFGVTPERMRLCWLPDTFGYNGNLPQILRGTGMDWFSTIKLSWNKVNTFPHRTFHWQGIDGSTVLVHMPPEGDYNSRAAADGLLRGVRQYPERELGTALLVYGSGDGGGGPGEIHLELIERERNLRGLPRVEESTVDAFFRELETKDITHTHSGELYLELHQGTYTTQARIKLLNRTAERTLHDAEALAAIVGEHAAPALEEHWRDVLLNQFHDIIPGSSIERVNREAIATYERVIAEVEAYIDTLIARLPRADGPRALNLTSFARREHVHHDGAWFETDAAPYASAALIPAPPHPELAHTADTMTNGVVSLRFDATGQIVSLRDAQGREHAGAGLNRLVLHDDPYQFPWDAWDIDPDYTRKRPRVLDAVDAHTVIDGPRVVRIQRHRTKKLEIEQRIVLEAGSDLVRCETRVDWREKHRMLRAEFRPSRYGAEALCEIQFGHIARPTTERDSVEKAQFEVCAHRWIAVRDEAGGFALLNDAKYGHRAKNGLLSLNLLRATTFPDKTADRGTHRFTYAFRPFDAGDLVSVVRDGYRLNNPLRVIDGRELASAASVSDEGVVIDTIKPAEDGHGVIVRLYESLGRPTRASLRTSLPHATATLTDMLERPLGPADLDDLAFGPFQVVTVRLEA